MRASRSIALFALLVGCHELEPTRPMTPVLDPASAQAPEPAYRESDNPLAHELAGDEGGGGSAPEHHHHEAPP